MLGAVASPLLWGAVPSRLLCMAADSSGIDIAYEAMDVHDMQLNVMDAGAADRKMMGPVAVWNPGINTPEWGTAKNVTITSDDGRRSSIPKRERCLRYILQKFQNSTLQVMGLVDCGLHEIGVDGLEQELQAIVDDLDPTPGIRIHRFQSYLFLHTDAVEIELIEWRHLFTEERLNNDARRWLDEGKKEAEINNLLKRRHWRGSLVVDLKMPVCNAVCAEGGSYRDGLAMRSGAAPPAAQMRVRLNFLHSPVGGKQVELPWGEFADHSAPDNDRKVLEEALATAIIFATERDESTEIDAWAVLGDTNLNMKEVADNSNDVGDVDDDVDDDDYVYFRMLCPAACNRK